MKNIFRNFKHKNYFDHIPGASQRLPVKAWGQLQINPAPTGAHCPPLRPNTKEH